jgi:hypothetical protein
MEEEIIPVDTITDDLLYKIFVYVISERSTTCSECLQPYYFAFYKPTALAIRSVCRRWRIASMLKIAQNAFSVCTNPKSCVVALIRRLDAEQERTVSRQAATNIRIFPFIVSPNYKIGTFIVPQGKKS